MISHSTEMESPQHGASSPYRYLMTSSQSAPDMTVQGLVDRFNTLEVKDMDEEKMQKAMRRLEAALRRAEMAREEAETEAKCLRDELHDQRQLHEERQRERGTLRERLDEYEKKYDKAKDRFRQQKVKHEENIKKMARDYMEREKQHWRQEQQLQEEVEWERRLRNDANDLIAFLEIERIVALQSRRDARDVVVAQIESPRDADTATEDAPEERHTPAPAEPEDADMETAPEADMDNAPEADNAQDEATTDKMEMESATQPQPQLQPIRRSPTPSAHDSHLPSPQSPPLKQTLLVPINFNDDDEEAQDEDKENAVPRTPSRHVSAPPYHKTPTTVSCATPFSTSQENVPDFLKTPIDREAALKAIRERRGRARSNGAATMTPKVSMPRSLSVGRKGRGLDAGR